MNQEQVIESLQRSRLRYRLGLAAVVSAMALVGLTGMQEGPAEVEGTATYVGLAASPATTPGETVVYRLRADGGLERTLVLTEGMSTADGMKVGDPWRPY